MVDLLSHLAGAPLANILVLSGLVFLAIGVIGKISDKIDRVRLVGSWREFLGRRYYWWAYTPIQRLTSGGLRTGSSLTHSSARSNPQPTHSSEATSAFKAWCGGKLFYSITYVLRLRFVSKRRKTIGWRQAVDR